MSVTYEFKVDWDATDWTATPDFTQAIDDITSYVISFSIDRGKKVELGNSPAGIADITLDNSSKRFSPPYAGPLSGKMRPWLPVRIRATVTGGSALVIYTGFISRISVNPNISVQKVYLYCTDGMDLLARNMVTTNKDDRDATSDGGAIDKLLNAAGWSASKRSLDTDGGDFLDYPSVTEY